MTADLIAFLRARLDEAADDAERGYLHAPELPDGYTGRDRATAVWLPPAVARHVLAEVEAKRAIIKAVDGLSGQWYDEIEGRVLERLALPYADHPEYREEWRP